MKALNGVKTSDSGTILGFQYHDGMIKKLVFDAVTSQLTVDVESLSGSVLTIRMESLKKIRIDNFLEGNIVSNIYLWMIEAINQDIPSITLPAWRLLLAGAYDNESFQGEVMRNVKKYSGLTLLLIEPSYGCVIVAVGGAVHVIESAPVWQA